MPKLEVGSVGPVVEPGEGLGFVDTAVELEAMGYSAIWLSGPLASREQLAETVRATDRVRVASGIIAVESFRPDDVAAVYSEVEATHPGRLVIGLGGAHGPNPMATRSAYLDRLDQLGVPAERRALAALGPRMVDLARERAAAAYSVLVTPDYTTQLRSRVGGQTTLAVDQMAVVEPEPDRARAIARGPLRFLADVPAYQASFRRQGFTDDDIAERADRLVDSVFAWGDADAVAAHVRCSSMPAPSTWPSRSRRMRRTPPSTAGASWPTASSPRPPSRYVRLRGHSRGRVRQRRGFETSTWR